jgi:hypothetical protein
VLTQLFAYTAGVPPLHGEDDILRRPDDTRGGLQYVKFKMEGELALPYMNTTNMCRVTTLGGVVSDQHHHLRHVTRVIGKARTSLPHLASHRLV